LVGLASFGLAWFGLVGLGLVGGWVLKGFGPYGIILNVCAIVTVATATMLRDFGPCDILFMTMCVYYFRSSR
jgi:hypothetical protein